MPYKIRTQKQKKAFPVYTMSWSEELIEQIRSHPQWIWGGLAIIVLVSVAFLSIQFFDKRAETSASALEFEASKLFYDPPPLPQPVEEGKEDEPVEELLEEDERLKKSAALFDEIIQEHSGTSTAAISYFESGNVFFKLGEYDKAEERYLSFLKKYPEKKGLVTLVHLKLAYLHQKKGDSPTAITHFKTVYEMPEASNKDQAGFEWARILELDDKTEEAVTLYEKISEDYSKSPWGTEAKARLFSLKPPEVSSDAGSSSEENKEGGDAPVEKSEAKEGQENEVPVSSKE
ncbi:MAG: tol-pal system YbgF family protein [Nitrospiria bacterium]